MSNQFVWVDIPCVDLDRAIGFYAAVLGGEVSKMDYPGMALGLLPHVDGGNSGCLYVDEEIQPGDRGPLVYLNCEGRLDQAVAAVELAGGKILQSRHQIGPHGYRAVIRDSEGNRIALHSM